MPTIDVHILALAAPAAVDAAVGRPKVTPIENPAYAEQMPGEWREYELGPDRRLMVRFFREQAVVFTLQLDDGVYDAATALALLGIDVGDMPPETVAPAGRWWAGEVDGLTVRKAGATRGGIHGEPWISAQVILPESPV